MGKCGRWEPGGGGSLLAGTNGSGKSTLVDALLTLLVPNLKRGYNMASGSDKRKERDETTYVRGAWGKGRDATDSVATQFLRSKKEAWSVILASFGDRGGDRSVTLAQCFWFERDQLKKLYMVAEKDVTIETGLNGFKDVSELRRMLRSQAGVHVYNTFKDYEAKFRRLTGIRSSQALELFNQTVSLKAIGDLNAFVRRQCWIRENRSDGLRIWNETMRT